MRFAEISEISCIVRLIAQRAEQHAESKCWCGGFGMVVSDRGMPCSGKERRYFGGRSCLAEELQKENRLGSEFTHNNQINQDAQLKAGL